MNTDNIVCPKCKGEKFATYRHTEYNGDWYNKKSICETCSGSGFVNKEYCTIKCHLLNTLKCELVTQREDGFCRMKNIILEKGGML